MEMRAAIIGLGNIAWKYDAHLPFGQSALSQAGAIAKNSQMILVGGCDPNPLAREAFSAWSGCASYETPESMLSAVQIDFVGICSPTPCHYTHAVFCLNANIPMLWLEKPPTASLQELEALVEQATEKNTCVCVNYFRRYLTSYQNLRYCLLNDTFGKCYKIRLLYSPGLARNGVHLLDLVFFLTNATSFDVLFVETKADIENPSFVVRLSTGHLVEGCGLGVNYHTNDVSLLCEKGVISITKGGKVLIEEPAVPDLMYPGFFELGEQEHTHLLQQGLDPLDGCMENALKDIIQAYQQKGFPLSNLHTALLSQTLLDNLLEKAGE